MGRSVTTVPGSAPRCSQPLSGFQHARASWPCLMPQPFLGLLLPPERSPRKDRAPLSGPPAPLQSSAAGPGRTLRHRSPRLSPVPALAQAWFPSRLWAPFRRAWPVACLPVPLGPGGREPPSADSIICFEASFPLRVRSHRPGFPRSDGRCSPGVLAPLELCRSRLGSCSPDGREVHPRSHPQAETATRRSHPPRARSAPAPECPRRSAAPGPLGGPDRAASRRRPFSLGLGPRTTSPAGPSELRST